MSNKPTVIVDPYFRKIVTKPDNVPIVGMLFLVPFFTWFSMREAVRNDQRVKDGKPCEPLARVAWARRGLGGEIPDVDPAIERSLAARCQEQTRASGELR